MRVSGEEAERLALDQIEPQYVQNGYRFVRQPRNGLPAFLGSYVPDAVAFGTKKNIVIEVLANKTNRSEGRISRLKKLFEEQDGWELRTIYFSSLSSSIDVLPVEQFKLEFENIRSSAADFPKGVFILAWSALEGATRLKFQLEQDLQLTSPRSLVSLLSSEGFLLGEDVSYFLRLSDLRNQLVHGRLDLKPTAKDVDVVLNLVAVLLQDE